ncbi:MAG: peptidoglycan-binding protein [Cellulosilyticaceae bacterium]
MPRPFYPAHMSRQAMGTLIVDLTTDPALGPISPVANIPVLIKEILPNGTTRTIAELTTNVVGQTPPIELLAPSDELSQVPQNTEQPYSVYTVEIQSSDYIPTVVNATQIFSNIRSILPVYLIPTRTAAQRQSGKILRDQTNEIDIGASTLWGTYPPKIPESEVKDTAAKGFITLDSVVVPEFVVVHDGSPNNMNASNYTVAFKDYIKNVASSEIYPTWPTQTILANVLAIISFTLNRVYTEWYRNQGRNFTITNSTAFDHAFFYGRDIFDTISLVVDEYFDTYIKRPGVEQPLLTQYCDGAKSSCPNWMTQWGSKDMGAKGQNAEQILRYYYGQNILFPAAPKVQGNPESYPGSPLKEGSSGSSVRKIQEQLNRISQNYPLIPKVKTNGEFDVATTEAVKTFQKIFHLPQDGVVGKNTWYEISRIYVAVTKIGELLP